ncbi:WD40-repeat-containing domain protein [Mucor mucedo]|uniref:WD40-repeat-containing domain protein n=1 Tax=Mucor mucedo TaxID=29922 RepID=UPI00221F5435|nr:WD40-repeat-containing domain protein [Mucor mucedo]KAI7894485.1 WD40-repeat-containing domain protein [Mucor mucedo]
MFLQQRSFDKRVTINQSLKGDKPILNNGLFVSIKKSYYVSTFIQHWKLRDLICSLSNTAIIHPKQNAIYKFDTKTQRDTKFHSELSFTPTTLDTRGQYMVVGGQTGIIMLKNLVTGYFRTYRLGEGMNKSVCLSEWNTKLRVVVCNSDQSVYVSTIPELEKIQTLKMAAVINYCIVSPDGKKLLMASDHGGVYLYHINKYGLYQEQSSYKVSNEPCISCAWNQSSDMFAVTSQDGFVSVFNIHSGLRLAQLGSFETRKAKKAARCVQFSSGPIDLLAYTEHVSNIYIVDTRTFETRQIVRLSPENEDRAITGFTFSPDCRKLFVALQDHLIELEVDRSERTQFGAGSLI